MSRRVLFWVLFLAVIALDQATKAWARSAFGGHIAPGYPWPGVFELTLTYNKGIAFGLFQGFGVALAPVAIAISVGAWFYSYRHPTESAWAHAAMALLAGGAIGNLYDRLTHGRVTDMFWFRAIDFPVFNVADSCITAAAAILILRWGGELLPKAKKHHEPAAPTDPGAVLLPAAETSPKDAS